MSLALLSTDTTVICRVVKALYDAAPGYTYLQNFLSYKDANGLTATVNALTNSFSSSSNADLAATVCSNIGLTGTAYSAGVDYMTAQFNAVAATARGQVIADAMQALSNLSGDATFGSFADAFNASVSTAEAYSTNSANTSTNLSTLQAADEVSTSVSFTTGIDTLTGSSGNDTFVGGLGAFLVTDTVDGGDGNDTMTVRVNSANGMGAVDVDNVETINFNFAGAAVGAPSMDFAGSDGYTKIGIAGAITALDITNLTAGVTLSLQSGFNASAVTVALSNETSNTTASTDSLVWQLDGASAFIISEAGGSIEKITIDAVQSYTNVTGSFVYGTALQSVTLEGTSLGIGIDVHSAASAFTVDASTVQGNVKLLLDVASGASTSALNTVTLGSGNDTLYLVTTAARSVSAWVLNGGEGSDTLRFSGTTGNALAVGSRITGFETLHLDAGGFTGTIDAGTAFNLGTIDLSGTADAGSATLNVFNTTLNVKGGFGADVVVTLQSTATTADAFTVNISDASAFNLVSVAGMETLAINFNGGTTAIGSAANVWSAGTAGIMGVGSADVTVGGTAASIAAHLVWSGMAGSGIAVLAASGYEGDATITVKTDSAATIDVDLGAGDDTLSFVNMSGAGQGTTAYVDGGAGTDRVIAFMESGVNTLANLELTNVEILRIDQQSTAATAVVNIGSMGTALQAVELYRYSAANNTASLNLKNIGANVTDISIAMISGATAAVATNQGVTLNFADDNTVTIDLSHGQSANVTATMASLTINSADSVTIETNGSGATGGTVSVAGIVISGADDITFNVYNSLKAGTISAGTATSVNINVDLRGSSSALIVDSLAATGADVVIVANGSDNSAGTLTFSSLKVGDISSYQDLTITLGSGLSGVIESAAVSNDLTLTLNGGTSVGVLTITELGMSTAMSAGNTGGNSLFNVAINGSASTLTIGTLQLGGDSGSMILNFSGLGDLNVNALSYAAGASGLTGVLISASELAGTFVLVGTGASGSMTVYLGSDVASANNIQLGSKADKAYGGGNGDFINGQGGNDTIYGYGGVDVLIGGVGTTDKLYGGDGNDVFRITTAAFTALGAVAAGILSVGGDSDTVMDWEAGDQFFVSGIQSIETAGTRSSNSVAYYTATLVGAAGTNSGAMLAVYQNGGDTYIELSVVTATGALTLGSGVYQLVLNGVSGWTAVSGFATISIESSGLVILGV